MTFRAGALAAFCAAFAITAAARDEGRHDSAPLLVLDADGKTIGKFGSGPSNTFVAIKLKGESYAVDLSIGFYGDYPYQFEDFSKLQFASTTFYFLSFDCSGTPYIATKQPVGMKPAAILRYGAGPTQRMFLVPFQGKGYLKGPLYHSRWDGTCQTAFSSPAGDGLGLAPAGPSIEITGMFKEPFTVE